MGKELRESFKLVYLSVLGITLIILGVLIWLASRNPHLQVDLFKILSHAFAVGFGFVAGGYMSRRR